MSRQVGQVDTLFCHGEGEEVHVAVVANGRRQLRGVLELKTTDAGPRPARLRVKRDSDEEPRPPDAFVDIARRSERIRISEQTTSAKRSRIRAMLDAYQLDATAVRTCRICTAQTRYSPITEETAIDYGDGQICPDCARAELDSELAYRGELTGAAKERLGELALEVGDLDRILSLLEGGLDPELTKVDEIEATVDAVDPVRVEDLDVHPELRSLVADRFETLLPVQSRAIHEGATRGVDQLVVSATATGKTLIGELAGIDRALRGEGKLLFLVPLVALANQKYGEFQERYGELVDVSLRIGGSRIGGGGSRFDPSADVIVGTYEGIDHALRTGRDVGDVGTVVIDEVHTLGEGERGHRLDGLIARLHHYCVDGAERGERPPTGERGETTHEQRGGDAQWIYLSATVGNPEALARSLDATLVEFEERPVPIERHLTFADGQEKTRIENRLIKQAFDAKSSKGYRGQTIVFTNSRRRCHEISRKLEYASAPYHAGLDGKRRSRVEAQFADQELAAVVTTAALAAGVDFPASQVIFDSLAMGIEWLTVSEFHQMLGRAGRPDYHDEGTVWLLVEPDGLYHHGMDRTEDEVAFELLKGEMEPVTTRYDGATAVAETLANVAVAGAGAKRLNDGMVGDVPTKHAVGKLLEYGFIEDLAPTPLGRAITEHFLSPEEAHTILEQVRAGTHPYDVVAELALRDDER